MTSSGSTDLKVIVKVEKGKLLLFFPETPANFGRIECWDGAHCEADLGYYRSLRNPEEDGAPELAMARFEKLYQCAGPFKLIRVRRDSDKMRRARWKR